MSAPYITRSSAVAPFDGAYDYDIRHAHNDTAHACGKPSRAQQQARNRVPCGEGGVVAACPRVQGPLDTWVTGYNNSLYAVNGEANFPWPEQTGRPSTDRYVWQPKLLSSRPGIMKDMSLPGMMQWNEGGGAPIANVFGITAPPGAFQTNVYGMNEEQAMQSHRAPPPRAMREPRAGTWLR